MTNDEIVSFMIDILKFNEETNTAYFDYAGYTSEPLKFSRKNVANLIAIVNDKVNYKTYLTEDVVTALLYQYNSIYKDIAVLVELEVDPNKDFKGFRKNVKAFLKRNPRFYILHDVYIRGKSFHLASVTNTDDYVATSEAFVDRLIRDCKCFHNDQLPIVKANTDSVNL